MPKTSELSLLGRGGALNAFLAIANGQMVKRLRFMAGGVAVFFAVLLPGALWYKGAQRSIAFTSARETSLAIQRRVNMAAQNVGVSLAFLRPWLWDKQLSSPPKNKGKRLQRQLPFDVATIFTHERKFYDGFRVMSESSRVVDLSSEAASLLFVADSGLFDRIGLGQSFAGLLNVEGRPLLIAAERIAIEADAVEPGYLIVGKWLSSEQLLESPGNAVAAVSYYSLANDSKIPDHVRDFIPAAQRNQGLVYEVDKDGRGVLFALISDVNGRPAVIAESAWEAPWRAVGSLGFGIFFTTAAIAGLGTWMMLIWGDARSRRRVRRFDGLSSLTLDHIKVLVEAFPGYAFAVKSSGEYLAVSRILAGVSGHEPSYFAGQVFGSVASETSDQAFDRLAADLRDPDRWPRVANLKHSVEGLGERFDFSGAAHYLAKQDVMFIILTDRHVSDANNSRKKPPSDGRSRSRVA